MSLSWSKEKCCRHWYRWEAEQRITSDGIASRGGVEYGVSISEREYNNFSSSSCQVVQVHDSSMSGRRFQAEKTHQLATYPNLDT